MFTRVVLWDLITVYNRRSFCCLEENGALGDGPFLSGFLVVGFYSELEQLLLLGCISWLHQLLKLSFLFCKIRGVVLEPKNL